MQCESRAPPDLLEEDGLAHPMVDVEELEMPIGELRGDQVDDDVECAGQLCARAGDEAQGLPRVLGVERGLDWSGRARLNFELRFEGRQRHKRGRFASIFFSSGWEKAVDVDSEYAAPGAGVFMSAGLWSQSVLATFSEGSIDRVLMSSGSWLANSVKSTLQVRLKPPTPPMCGILAWRSHFESKFAGGAWSCLVPSYLTPVTVSKKSGHTHRHGQSDSWHYS